MARHWKNYIDKNIASECQLITALNAHYRLTGKVYCRQDSDEYQQLMDLCKARHGSALCIKKVHRKLGIKVLGYCNSLRFPRWSSKFYPDPVRNEDYVKRRTIHTEGKLPLPIEAIIWHYKCGYHSVLIVDHDLRTDCVRVAIFRWETVTNGWMFLAKLLPHVICAHQKWPFRLFGLRGTSLRYVLSAKDSICIR